VPKRQRTVDGLPRASFPERVSAFSFFFQIQFRPGIGDYSNEIRDMAILLIQNTAKRQGQNVFCAMRSQCSRTESHAVPIHFAQRCFESLRLRPRRTSAIGQMAPV
jgi:hypothetical protein